MAGFFAFWRLPDPCLAYLHSLHFTIFLLFRGFSLSVSFFIYIGGFSITAFLCGVSTRWSRDILRDSFSRVGGWATRLHKVRQAAIFRYRCDLVIWRLCIGCHTFFLLVVF